MKTLFEQLDNMGNNSTFIIAIAVMGAIFLFLIITEKLKEK